MPDYPEKIREIGNKAVQQWLKSSILNVRREDAIQGLAQSLTDAEWEPFKYLRDPQGRRNAAESLFISCEVRHQRQLVSGNSSTTSA